MIHQRETPAKSYTLGDIQCPPFGTSSVPHSDLMGDIQRPNGGHPVSPQGTIRNQKEEEPMEDPTQVPTYRRVPESPVDNQDESTRSDAHAEMVRRRAAQARAAIRPCKAPDLRPTEEN